MSKAVRKKAVQQLSDLSLDDLESKLIGAFGGIKGRKNVQFSDEGLALDTLCFQPTTIEPAGCLKTVKVTPQNHVQDLFDFLEVPLELRADLRELFYSNPSLVLALVSQGWCICQDPADVRGPEIPALLLKSPKRGRREQFLLGPYDQDTLRDASP